jgi:3-mercaptopyruvate sulfurtransferase SseA
MCDPARAFASPLVDTAWLEAHLGDAALRVFGCTTHPTPDPATIFHAASGRADRLRAQVPGAGFLDVAGALSDGASGGGGTAPTAVAPALALLGRDDVAVYEGSMQEWCADPARPVERGGGGTA